MTDIQPIIDQLLIALVSNVDAANLSNVLSIGFRPSSGVDLITEAAGVGSERDSILSILIQYGIQ